MFTLLVTQQSPKGLWNRLFGRGVCLEEHHTMDIPWRLIRANCSKGGLDWRKIERLAGRHRARVVSSAACCPPQGSRVEFAELYSFDRVMAARAVCRLLEGQAEPEVVGVIDPVARCLSAVEILLDRAKCVMVYTEQPHRYEWFARHMLRRKGAPVLLCGSTRGMEDCRFVLLGGMCENWQQWVPANGTVFSAVGERPSEGKRLVCGFVPECSSQLLRQIPDGVPPHDICAALYQLASCRELGALQVKSCRLDGVSMNMDQLEKMFEKAA